MRLAIECPTNLLRDIQPLADFDFMLAHLVLTDTGYAEYYAQSKRHKILDNSTNELLEPVHLDALGRAAEIVKPDFIVAPDFLGDSEMTVFAIKEAIKSFGLEGVIPVVQGSTLPEVLGCLSDISALGFTRVAVPYDITCHRLDSLVTMARARMSVVHTIEMTYDLHIESVHLLGLTTLEEVAFYSGNPAVESIDTGSPVLHGLRGIRYESGIGLLPKSTPTMNQMPTSRRRHLEDVFYNIAMLRRVIHKGD